ncbi:MAG: NAD(P)H-quinone oxidoreductase [Bryobacteraceae bacterium]|nr:NAD(P)H-quinone oxidoreductase [Bryobacteraceae bacterium]MDW8378352.1 NAD(P)H-quinone oxidoreductase [Bryobacterales bacterium]
MKAIVVEGDRRNPVLRWREVADVRPGPGEVLLDVRAAGVNRADLLQARGSYPPPAGASDILGLEVCGIIRELGPEVKGWELGERVCALLPGGGYAERAVCDAEVLMRVPPQWSDVEAAAFPEAWITAYVNLFEEGALVEGESVLIHAGASGVGLAAIQLARAAGATVYATAGSAEKISVVLQAGAHHAINYREQNFADQIRKNAGGVDLILDCVGGAYLAQNISLLKRLGRLVNIGLLGGRRGELELDLVLSRRLRIIGSTLRSRSRQEHARLARALLSRFGSLFLTGQLRIIIDSTFPIAEAQKAHERMAQNLNAGKIVLTL